MSDKIFRQIEYNESLEDFAMSLINQDIFYKGKRRQNNKLIIDDHLIPVRDKLVKIVTHKDYRDIAASYALLHDILEDFQNLIKSANPYMYTKEELSIHVFNYFRSLNYLLEPAKDRGKSLIYVIDKSSKRKAEQGKKYSENVFRLNDFDRLTENLLVVNMKNCDINSNTNPYEKVLENYDEFIVKKVRNSLRYLSYDLPKLEEILVENKDYKVNGELLFNYEEADKILRENYFNIFTFLELNPIYDIMKKNINMGLNPLGKTSLLDIEFYKDALVFFLENGFSDRFKNLERCISLLD